MGHVLLSFLLLASLAFAGCSSGGGADQDGDLLSDANEKRGYDIYIDLLGSRIVRHVTSDPTKYDTDNDGLSDYDEYGYPAFPGSHGGLDPRDADTDDDGLTDCQEALHTIVSDCENPDFPGPYDGGYDTHPGNADSDPFGSYWAGRGARYEDKTGSIVAAVLWGDGLSDGQEVLGYDVTIQGRTVRVTSDPLDSDSDGDALDDGEEALLYDADPTVPDTDGDGCRDGQDPWPDREESYKLNLQSIKLLRSKDGTINPGSDLVLHSVMSDREFIAPSSGSRRLTVNQETSIADLDPGAQPPNCGDGHFPPLPSRPWLYLGFAARDPDTSGSEILDITSVSQAGASDAEAGAVYWNVRTGQFSWTLDGAAPFEGPLVLKGLDAELRLAPTIV